MSAPESFTGHITIIRNAERYKKDASAVAEATGPVTISNDAAKTSLSDNEALSALREKLSGN
jgi:hypothetical protein